MNRQTTSAHVETWQFFSSCVEIFKSRGGTGFMAALFRVSVRQMQRWSCDPDFSESAQRNILDRYEKTLKALMEMGRKDVARGAVDRQASIVGCHLACDFATPDKENLSDELLDDLPAISKLHKAILDQKAPQIVREALQKAKRELDEDYQAYLRDMD